MKRLFAILAVWAGIVLAAAPVVAQSSLPEPTRSAGSNSEMWKSVRQGAQGYVSIPDKKAGVLVQSEGENWRNWRNRRQGERLRKNWSGWHTHELCRELVMREM